MSLPITTVPADINWVRASPKPEPVPFHQYLSGENAFYLQPDYLASTKSDFSAKELQTTHYTRNSGGKIGSLARKLLSIFNLPRAIHSLIGKFGVLPASSPFLLDCPGDYAERCRSTLDLSGPWKYKRVSLSVDGYRVDAAIIGQASTLGNGRWVAASNGNAEVYEQKLRYDREFKSLLSHLDSNAIVFNYPGVGSSSGLPNRQAMAKAYRAVLSFLEDGAHGIGAREIIGYGHSIGGGVQGDALEDHELKNGVKYVFVKSRTFRNLKDTASDLLHSICGFFVDVFGWNIDTARSSKRLQAPEIILQTARVKAYKVLKNSSKIIDDDIIGAKVSLAKELLDSGYGEDKGKYIIGIPDRHNDDLTDPAFVAAYIDWLLSRQQVFDSEYIPR